VKKRRITIKNNYVALLNPKIFAESAVAVYSLP